MDIGDILLPEQVVETDSWDWATVTQASPLRIRLDGETTSLSVTPTTLVAGLTVGDRVWTQLHNKQFIVLGKVS